MFPFYKIKTDSITTRNLKTNHILLHCLDQSKIVYAQGTVILLNLYMLECVGNVIYNDFLLSVVAMTLTLFFCLLKV